MKTPPSPRPSSAFTLIELLVVVAMMGILLVLVIPAWNHISVGMTLTRASDSLGDAIVMARQEASSQGREVRIVFLNQGTNENRGFQVMKITQNADGTTNSNAITRKIWLPDSVMLSETASPLLNVEADFKGFRFRGGGKPGSLSSTNNYLTLKPNQTTNNFIVLQVNPLTGRVQKYQP